MATFISDILPNALSYAISGLKVECIQDRAATSNVQRERNTFFATTNGSPQLTELLLACFTVSCGKIMLLAFYQDFASFNHH